MNSQLQVFDYNGSAVRTVEKDGEIWFVAKDVCDVLELTNPTEALKALDDDEKSSLRISEGTSPKGGNPNMNVINEGGVYSLVFRSNKPEAKAFSRWVRHVLLPQIRKTGSYNTQKQFEVSTTDAVDAARIIFQSAGINGNQCALALDKIYRSHTGYSALETGEIALVVESKHQALNPTQIGKILGGKSPRKVNELLERLGFQVKVADLWQPTDDGQVYAVMLDTGKRHSDGSPVRQLKWDSDILNILQEDLDA